MIKVLLQISVEKIFGFSYLKQLYKKNYSDPDFNNNFWKKTLEILRINIFLKMQNVFQSKVLVLLCLTIPLEYLMV